MRKINSALAFAVLLLVGCATPTQQELATADYGSYPTDFEQIIKNHMQATLKDPESARYQFLNSPKSGWNSFGGLKYGYVVCAYINAKNSYGGYVGNRISYFLLKNDRVIDTMHGDGNYVEAMVQGRCKVFI